VRRIEVERGSLFGKANLPYGVFSTKDAGRRVGVRIGDAVVDLVQVLGDDIFGEFSLNAFMAEGYDRWVDVRQQIGEAVSGELPDDAVHPIGEVKMHLPIEIGDYVDFYASEHHASNLGKLFRPGADPLTPNWKHMPIGYHGRSGTVVVSGTDIVRPCGQLKAPDKPVPVYGESRRLDIEAELGFIIGTDSEMGSPVGVGEFARRVFGVVLVNDWSARDIQAWEYVPLGPFLGKSFATSVSAWVIPLLALEAARVPTPKQDPQALRYLRTTKDWGLDIDLAVSWNGEEVSRPPYREMYWSPAQMLAHMTANGASVRTGDLFASGTISGPGKSQRGAFIELTWDGSEPVEVNGQRRTYLVDGDEVVISATAPGADGEKLGLGEVRGRIVPATAARSLTPTLDPSSSSYPII